MKMVKWQKEIHILETEASVIIDGLTVRVQERKTSRMTLRFVALISVWMVVQLAAGQRIDSFVMVRIILRGLRDEMSSRVEYNGEERRAWTLEYT